MSQYNTRPWWSDRLAWSWERPGFCVRETCTQNGMMLYVSFKHMAVAGFLLPANQLPNHDTLVMNARPYFMLLPLALITAFNLILFIYVLPPGLLPFILYVLRCVWLIGVSLSLLTHSPPSLVFQA